MSYKLFKADVSKKEMRDWNVVGREYDHDQGPTFAADLMFDFLAEDEVPERARKVDPPVLGRLPSEELIDLVKDSISVEESERVIELLGEHEGEYYDELRKWLKYWCNDVGVSVNLVKSDEFNNYEDYQWEN